MLDADDVPCVPLDAVRRTASPRAVVVPCYGARLMRLRLLSPVVVRDYREGMSIARIRAAHGLGAGDVYVILHDVGVPLRTRSKGAK